MILILILILTLLLHAHCPFKGVGLTYMANLASCVAHMWAVFMSNTRVSKHVLYTCEHACVTHVWAHMCEILIRVKHM